MNAVTPGSGGVARSPLSNDYDGKGGANIFDFIFPPLLPLTDSASLCLTALAALPAMAKTLKYEASL